MEGVRTTCLKGLKNSTKLTPSGAKIAASVSTVNAALTASGCNPSGFGHAPGNDRTGCERQCSGRADSDRNVEGVVRV